MRHTRVTNVSPSSLATPQAQLRVVSGPDEGTEVDLPPVGVVVGADSSADVRLADDAVSGRHLTVVASERGFFVEDLDSKNGTFVDGVAINKATVPIGAMLRVGHSILQLLPAENTVEIPPSDSRSFGTMIGSSLSMRRVFSLLERASKSDAGLLLLGESGTGKELAARAIHAASPRADGPFVVFDCGAASENLIESTLFGHTRGAFTGATGDRIGVFAAAHGGTLFLDEIGELPVPLQPKLLRMLESGQVTPLGSHHSKEYDVRFVAATHRDLFDEVGRGGFRGDLYYRLAVVEAQLPALRQRIEDVPELVKLFLSSAGRGQDEALDGSNMEKLLSYRWPGNVRELRNVIARAVALSAPDSHWGEMPILLRPRTTGAEELPTARADKPFHEAKAAVVDRFEREYLTDLLARASGNVSQAARIAGLERKHLYKVLDRTGLRSKST